MKAVSLLLRLVDLDRDTAVIMCGLDAKQSLQKAIERHESIPVSVTTCFISKFDMLVMNVHCNAIASF